MTGLLLIDKPEGLSSFDVVRRVRRAVGIRRVGHGGTLDPFATGLLPVAVGETTRLLEFMLAEDKRYRATMRLGIATDTLDLTGEVVAEAPVGVVNAAVLEDVMAGFRGTISQVPPMFSALKRDGVPLYKLARAGEEVERKARQVQIHELRLLAVNDLEVSFEVFCSKGTYVRTLADDIGRELGCGAHLVSLRRLTSGAFSLDRALTLDEIESWDWSRPHPGLLSPLQALVGRPVGQVSGQTLERLCCGVSPRVDEVSFIEPVPDGDILCLAAGERLVAVARRRSGESGGRRGDFELCKVFPGT